MRILADASSAAGVAVCPRREWVRGEKLGHHGPKPVSWGVPPGERARERLSALGTEIGDVVYRSTALRLFDRAIESPIL